jgi:hypothetical protein
VGRVGVPVGEQRKVQVESLRPSNVRPRRVARDRVRLNAGGAKLLAPVTQELQLARSGRRPVEQIEEKEDRAARDDFSERCALPRRRPHARVGDPVVGGQHGESLRGRRFGQLGYLAHDLDDVAVRVEDAQLAVGSVATTQDVLDARKLPL